MNESPVFTVIIPTYNREFLLKRAIDSILSQSFEEFELIIVDDGSVDNTKKLVDTYSDDRIVYIYIKHGGINAARNEGLRNAKGDYIAFCDSDDMWLPTKLEKHIQKYHEDKEIKVVYDLTGIVKTENGEKRITIARNDTCEGWCYKKVLEQGYLTSPTFLTCKKECFDKIGMLQMDLVNCEDDDLCFQLCKYFKVGLVKEILGIYYLDASNRISSMKKMCADDFYKFTRKWSSEILRVCGGDVLKRRYLEASYKYFKLDDINKAREIYQEACEAGNITVDKVRNMMREFLAGSDEIIIYGIDDWGEKVYKALKMIEFSRFIFAVTSLTQSNFEWHGVPVREIGMLNSYKNTAVIIASSKNSDEMKAKASNEGFLHIVSYKEVIRLIFDEI